MKQNNKRVLIYCRESRDDYLKDYERIETQRDILLDFCRRKGFEDIIEVILDDNISGTDFKRFDRVIRMAAEQKFDIIVFKDASRLGRNLLESLKFIENLKKLGIEILFENEEYNEDIFPLKAWFNEQRAKEDSKKIRHVLRHKMETGELIIKPSYGYIKKKGKLEIEPSQAATVKLIFALYENGSSTTEIADYLNKEGVDTPSVGKNLKNNTSTWNRQHILRILDNEVYIGKMTYGKTSRKSYKDKSISKKPESEWITIENHHQPIIEKQQFNFVRQKRNKRKNTAYVKKERPFSQLLKCGRCNSNLIIRTRKNRSNYYICSKYHKEGSLDANGGCFSHVVHEEKLFSETILFIQNTMRNTPLDNTQFNCKEDELKKLNLKLLKYNETMAIIYDDRLNGIIDEHMYRRKSKEYNLKIIKLKSEIERLSIRPKETAYFAMEECIDRKFITQELTKSIFHSIIYCMPGEIYLNECCSYLEQHYIAEINENGGLLFLLKDDFSQ